MTTEQALAYAKRNIKLIVLVNILTKRTYLPLSAVYFVQVSGLSVVDLGYVAALFAFTMLVSDLPTGYLADRIGRAKCIRIGGLLGLISMLMYVFVQNKLGVFTGMVFEGVAYGFLAGAGAALVHDSLELTKEEHRYSKVMSRSMSLSLMINAGLMVLVPLTYVVDPRLPFAVGGVAFVALVVMGFWMRDIRRHYPERLRLPAIKAALNRRALIAFVFVLGIVGAALAGPTELTKLALHDFGIRPEHLGWFFAGASVLGAGLGVVVHKLKEIPLPLYAGLDAVLAGVVLIAAFSGSPWIFGAAFMLVFAFWRYRRIIYQHHLLELYPTRYKGTLYSMLNASEEMHLVWVPIAVAAAAGHYGLAAGLGWSGVASLVLVPLIMAAAWTLVRSARREVAS